MLTLEKQETISALKLLERFMLKEEKGPDVNQGAGYRKCCRNKRSDDKITIIEIRLEILEVI